jgi:glycosyltransferase involved in cell wall biosynthesis
VIDNRRRPASILFITARFGSLGRGVEVSTHEIATRLAGFAYDVSILSGPHQVLIPGVTMIRLPMLRREAIGSFIRPGLAAKIAQRIRLGPSELEAASLRWAARWNRSVLTDFDTVVPQAGLAMTRWARSRWPAARLICIGQAGFVPKELRYADAFVALVKEDEERANSLFPGLTAVTIPHGVDFDRFAPARVFPEDHHIVCAGAFVRDKGHHYLLDAFLRLPDSVVLSCIGTGPEADSLARHPAVATGRVRFSSLTPDRMPSAYQSARIFTLPSINEVYGIVFIEALACGLPVVAHDVPRHRSVIGAGGYYADVRDPDAYAAALLRALEAGPDAERRTSIQHLAWGEIARQYAHLVDRASNSRQASNTRHKPS